MPKFSILTACHNDKKFLPATVKSVLAQNFSDWEWVIVDDCSTDRSYEYLKQIKDKRVRLFRNDGRLYCSSTYARALIESEGEICGVLDADDALVCDAVKTVFKRYNRFYGISYIYTQHAWCDSKLRRKRRGLSSAPPGNMSFVDAALKKRHCFSHWRTFRRCIVQDIDAFFPPGLKYAVDKHMGFALEELGKGAFFPRELYLYRYYKGNMSLTEARSQKNRWLEFAKIYSEKRTRGLSKAHPIEVIK